jgi:archaeal flagellin FlaB
MLRRSVRKFWGNQKGITGLETAIILIAFVVVAAVFSYAILSAGLYSSQKSQEAVYKGLKEAQGATTMKGGLIATAEPANVGNGGFISQFSFTVSNAMGGVGNDFTPPTASGAHNGKAAAGSPNKVTISYIDPYQKVDDLFWSLNRLGACNSDNILDSEELFQITVGDPVTNNGGGNLADALALRHLGVNTRFTLVITTPTGATLSLERTTPGFIDATLNLN